MLVLATLLQNFSINYYIFQSYLKNVVKKSENLFSPFLFQMTNEKREQK
jgi:hypothetical protein